METDKGLDQENLINLIADSLKRFQKEFGNGTPEIDNFEQLAEQYLQKIEKRPDLLIDSEIEIDNLHSKIIYTYHGNITLQNGDYYTFTTKIEKLDDDTAETIIYKLNDNLHSDIDHKELENYITNFIIKQKLD
jgi:hypothetical protein